jgi:hypothetical protein
VIIPCSEQRNANKIDDIIKVLDPYISTEFLHCFGCAEKRLEKLFEIKEKWTHAELKV